MSLLLQLLRHSTSNYGMSLKSGLEITQSSKMLGYGFLFASHSNYGCIFSRFDTVTQYTNVTDTARQHRPRLCITSRGKNKTRTSGARHSKPRPATHCRVLPPDHLDSAIPILLPNYPESFVFCKVGRYASEEVVLNLLITKCYRFYRASASVRLSVCPFVCPLRSGTRWKRLNISSQFFHRAVAQSF